MNYNATHKNQSPISPQDAFISTQNANLTKKNLQTGKNEDIFSLLIFSTAFHLISFASPTDTHRYAMHLYL